MTQMLSLTGNLLWSTVRLESYCLVISVKMRQITLKSDLFVLHLGISICLWLLLIAVNMQNCEIESAGLPFSLEIESPQHSCTRNLKIQSPSCEGGSTTQFEWYIELGKFGIVLLEKGARTKHRLHPQLSLKFNL